MDPDDAAEDAAVDADDDDTDSEDDDLSAAEALDAEEESPFGVDLTEDDDLADPDQVELTPNDADESADGRSAPGGLPGLAAIAARAVRGRRGARRPAGPPAPSVTA